MASLNKDSKGWKISFRDPTTKKQKTLRPGAKLPKKSASEILTRVEYLISARASNLPIDQATAVWLAGVGAELQNKLHRAGLIEKPESEKELTLGSYLTAYITGRTDLKDSTRQQLTICADKLRTFFGDKKLLPDINEGDASDFRLWLLETKAENTTRRTCGRAKQFFAMAVKKRLIDSNPFQDIKTNVQANPQRMEFVSRETAFKVLEACPSVEWQLLFALARFGGLRVPSEIRPLKWEDISWTENRITVHSPKTEHHIGGESRVIPLFPELLPYLEDQQELRPGSEYVFSDQMRTHTNPSTTLKKIIKRAGVKEWGKPFQNLRSTRETELAEEFAMHVVCDWIGNSQPVAMKHYMQITDDHFERAIAKSGNQGGNTGGNIPAHQTESVDIKKTAEHLNNSVLTVVDGVRCTQGLPGKDSNESSETLLLQSETEISKKGGNQGGNISGDCPRLLALVSVWDELSVNVQVEILRLAHGAVHG